MTSVEPGSVPADAGGAQREQGRRPELSAEAEIRAAQLALDRFALDRLVFDIKAWWARNPRLRAMVLSDIAGRLEEQRQQAVRPER